MESVVAGFFSFYKYSLLLIPPNPFCSSCFSPKLRLVGFSLLTFLTPFFLQPSYSCVTFCVKAVFCFRRSFPSYLDSDLPLSPSPCFPKCLVFSLRSPFLLFSSARCPLTFLYLKHNFFFLSLSGWVSSVVEESCSLKDKWKED